MKDWTEAVKTYHDWSQEDSDYTLAINGPAQESELERICGKINFPITAEFREFYLQVDGFGSQMEEGEVYWLLVPSAHLELTVEVGRDWMNDTHPEVAQRFFAFIDWSSGDFTGYLKSEDGELLPGLWEFSHEYFLHDSTQDYNDFLIQTDSSISELLATEP